MPPTRANGVAVQSTPAKGATAVDSAGFEVNSPAVIGEAIDGEVMVINLVSGTYYNLTGTAAAAWPMLSAGFPLDAIVAALSRACGADAVVVTRDLAGFVADLLAEDIVRAADKVNPPAALPDIAPATYTGFALNRYDDMRALLVVDPVHEVGDFGWPQPAEPRKPT
jgi:hypothetical protein